MTSSNVLLLLHESHHRTRVISNHPESAHRSLHTGVPCAIRCKRLTNVGASPTIGTYHATSVAIINMKSIKCNKSSAIQGLWVYPLEGKCSVQYNDGNIYEYSNVSRRAIFSIVTNDKQSIGKWVNHNCKTKGVACEWTGHESPWIPCVDELTPQLPNFI